MRCIRTILRNWMLVTIMIFCGLSSAFADPIKVAVFSRSTLTLNLNTDPDIVATNISNSQIEAGQLVNFDVLLGRFSSSRPSPAARAEILNFVANGGGYVGEWWGAGFALTDSVAPFRGAVAPTPLLGLFSGAASGGFRVAFGNPITVTLAHPVTQGLPSPFAAGGATEFFVQARLPIDPRLSVLATYPESGVNGPAGPAPAILAGNTGTANVVLLLFDAGDVGFPAPAVITQLVINSVKFAAEGEGIGKEIASGPDVPNQFPPFAAPDSITFETLNTTCSIQDTFNFELNGTPLGSTPSDPTFSCTCSAPTDSFAVTDTVLIASAWNLAGPNDLRFTKTSGGNATVAWTRATLHFGASTETFCVFDQGGGNCDVLNLCNAGHTFGAVDVTASVSPSPDGKIDAVVEIGQFVPTMYDFKIFYRNSDEVPVLIEDTVPAEWDVELMDDDGGNATAASANKKNTGKSATKIDWTPDRSGGSITVWAETRGPKKNGKFAPTSCGALRLNDGAAVFELDPVTGEPLVDESGVRLPPILESNQLCLAAVTDVDGNGVIVRDGSGDEDGDTLTDLEEACVIGTDPCLDDTDDDGVNDNLDACPLEGPPDAGVGELQDADGCNRQSQCSDGIDNDNDGPIDFVGGDQSCNDILDDSEDTNDNPPTCVCTDFWAGGNTENINFPTDVPPIFPLNTNGDCIIQISYQYSNQGGFSTILVQAATPIHTQCSALNTTQPPQDNLLILSDDPLADVQACILYVEDDAVPGTNICTGP